MRNCIKNRKNGTGTRSRILPPRLTKRGGSRFSVRKALREELPAPVIDLKEPTVAVEPPSIVPREADAPVEAERQPYDGNTAFNLYLREVGQTKLLTLQEENELAARIKKGDRKARERMIKANLRLVVKIAREYEDYGMPLLDLINEGNMGLMKAVERFDPAKGAKLSTYSAWWIKQAIKRALANQSKTIRLPVHVVDKLFHMRRASVKLQEVLGREPTDDELGEELGLPGRKVAQLRTAAIRPASLEAPLGDDETSRIADVIRDESADTPYEQLEGKTNIAMLRELVATLHPREAEILRYRFGLDGDTEKTLEDVGRKFGVTRERIRQIQNAALLKLRKQIEKLETVREAA
jgi:RNA polymerase primary sigma factor